MTTPVTVYRRRWDDPDATALRAGMTAELRHRYADRPDDPIHLPTAQVLTPTSVAWTGVAYTADATPVGHAAMRWHGPDLELKRMYVPPAHRGRGVAGSLLDAAREAAGQLGASRIVLQTGDRQPDAIRRYEQAGYRPIPVFAPYDTLPYSRCFALAVRRP
ncbi:GNAT family N-acetyltransferase [Micromonospora okii]|uniref:GNAT family N-acetyltransferase n=1 Tax=Micromonospora okii TaxID=1182970 RepID=UPI001E5A761D|nr:GNAT family N-acetyltransferase [Micromonospora okii]